MALTNAFYEAVNNGDVRRVRIMMKDSLLVDPTFVQFAEMEKVASRMSGLYDEHDGREFNMNKVTWDDDYMNKLKVQVVGNFSHERIEHLKEVVRYLRPVQSNTSSSSSQQYKRNYDSSNEKTIPEKELSYQEQKHRDQKVGNYREVKIASGAVVGAVIGGTIAAATSVTVIGGAVAGAVVGGTAVAIATSGGK